MYAHRTVKTISNLHIEVDLPTEFADCKTAEVIVLPIQSENTVAKTWEEKILAFSGVLGDDFPDDINDDDLGEDTRTEF